MVAILFFVMIAAVAPCQGKLNSVDTKDGEVIQKLSIHVTLALTGFNYTNRYIDRFTVGAQDGGNLFVSGPDGGGGGIVCCVPYIVGASAWKTKIRWSADACTYNNRIDEDGKEFFEIYHYFREVVVQIDKNIPKNPRYLEAHFYPDGHVEAVITSNGSQPRLILRKDRENNSPYRHCKDEKRPEE